MTEEDVEKKIKTDKVKRAFDMAKLGDMQKLKDLIDAYRSDVSKDAQCSQRTQELVDKGREEGIEDVLSALAALNDNCVDIGSVAEQYNISKETLAEIKEAMRVSNS